VLVEMIIQGDFMEDLVLDKFGNYFIQTLLANIDGETFNGCVYILTLDGDKFAEICNHQFGSHVIQTAINLSGGNLTSSAALAKCLCDNIIAIATHFLGSICLIHAIDVLAPSSVLCATLATEWRSLCLSRHGHVVMMHALERFDDYFVKTIGEHMLTAFDAFIADDFGYRVVLQILKQLQVRQVSHSSFISKLVGLVKFTARYFAIIEFLVMNFPNNEHVRNKLIPAIVRIVRKGTVFQQKNNN